MKETGPKIKADFYGRLLSDSDREEMMVNVVYTDDEWFHPDNKDGENTVETETQTEP